MARHAHHENSLEGVQANALTAYRCLGTRTLPCYTICAAAALALAGGASATSSPSCEPPLVTLEEVQRAARRRGMSVSVKDLGPFYRVVCRDLSGSSSSSSQAGGSSSSSSGGSSSGMGGGQAGDEEGGRVLGVTTGFVAPLFGIMHCDTLQIFTRGLKGELSVACLGGWGGVCGRGTHVKG